MYRLVLISLLTAGCIASRGGTEESTAIEPDTFVVRSGGPRVYVASACRTNSGACVIGADTSATTAAIDTIDPDPPTVVVYVRPDTLPPESTPPEPQVEEPQAGPERARPEHEEPVVEEPPPPDSVTAEPVTADSVPQESVDLAEERAAVRRLLEAHRARLDSIERLIETPIPPPARVVAQTEPDPEPVPVTPEARTEAAAASREPDAPAPVDRPSPPPPAPRNPTPERAPAPAPKPAPEPTPAPRTPVVDTRSPSVRLADSTGHLIAIAAMLYDDASVQVRIALADSLESRVEDLVASARISAVAAKTNAEQAIAQGNRLAAFAESGAYGEMESRRFVRYWELGRVGLDSARIHSVEAIEAADAAIACEERACVEKQAALMRDGMIAAAGAARKAESLIRIALRYVN